MNQRMHLDGRIEQLPAVDECQHCERNLKQAIADLGALERCRKHPAFANVIELLKMDRDDSACVNDAEVELFDELITLLQPGEVSRG